MTCQEVVELLTDYLEGALAPARRERLRVHLDECPPCQRYLDQLRNTIALLGRVDDHDVPDPVRSALVDAFRTWPRG